MNTNFAASKIQRELKRSGKDYDFFRLAKNAFGEPAGTNGEKIGTILGLYHEVNNFANVSTSEAGQVRKVVGLTGQKKQSMLLCLYESVNGCGLKFGDYTEINGRRFKVTGVVNVQEWNVIADISLEVVADGNQVEL